MPVLIAAGRRSSATASICFATSAAGSAPGIRSRNGERDSHEFPGRALAKARARAILGAPVTSTRTHIRSNLQSTVRDLQRRKARGRRGLAVVEGVRLVEEALAAARTQRLSARGARAPCGVGDGA